MRILQAMDNALDMLDLQRITETAPAARAELVEVLAKRADESAHRISAVGHAHIDSAWLWPVRETIRKVARTSSSMVEMLGYDEDFLYGMSSAQQYAWIKEHRPEVYDRVKEAVASGRFLPLGGMWVESDTVMPSGESLVRQFHYGQKFFREEFGVTSAGVWLPDSFGYSPALPQLMKRAGFKWFFTQKISWNQQNKFPHHTFNCGRASTARASSATSRRWTPTTRSFRARRWPAPRASSANRATPPVPSHRWAGATAAAEPPAR